MDHGENLLVEGSDYFLTLHDAPLRDLPGEVQPVGGFDGQLNKRPDKLLVHGATADCPTRLRTAPSFHHADTLPCCPLIAVVLRVDRGGNRRWVVTDVRLLAHALGTPAPFFPPALDTSRPRWAGGCLRGGRGRPQGPQLPR